METRGLSEEGIYRVSGSDKEIKALKERILRGKSLPILSNVDIHVICGCIKDFLRGLREPLIPTDLWKNFSNAVQTVDEAIAVRELFAAINQLPQPNRDTLAFLVMHLQRFVYMYIMYYVVVVCTNFLIVLLLLIHAHTNI